MKGEFIQHDVAGIAARRVGIGGQADDARAVVGKINFHRLVVGLRHLPEFAQHLEFAKHRAEILDLLHEQARLALALREDDVLRAREQALQHGAQRGGKTLATLPAPNRDLQLRVVLNPALLIGQHRNGIFETGGFDRGIRSAFWHCPCLSMFGVSCGATMRSDSNSVLCRCWKIAVRQRSGWLYAALAAAISRAQQVAENSGFAT